MPPRVTVVGSINRDLSVRVPELPAPGETVLGDHFLSVSGGKGANQAVAAARYGADVSFVGRLGRDPFGDELLDGLRAEGVDVEHIARDPKAVSGVALILVDGDGENCITVAPGANARLSAADVDAAEGVIAAADIVLVQLEIPLQAVRRAVRLARAHGVPVVLNPAPARELDDDLLGLVSVFTPNASEAGFYVGRRVRSEADARAAAETLLQRVGGAAVVTMGSGGASYADRAGLSGLVEGQAVQAVDSTAAGDVFNGVLSVRLAEGAALPDAVLHANAAAALSVTQHGAQSAIPSRAEVSSFRAHTNGRPLVHG